MNKILIVTSFFPYSKNDLVPQFVREQIIALKKEYSDLEFHVLAPHDPFTRRIELKENSPYQVYRFHYFWPFRFEKLAGRGILSTLREKPAYYLLIPFFILGELIALLRLVKKLKPHMIYAHWFLPQGLNAGIVSILTNTPFVYTTHSSDVAILKKIPCLGNFLVRFFSKKAKAITTVSRRSLDKLHMFFDDKEWKDLSDKINIIPMGVEIRQDYKPENKLPKKTKNILFIGRLVEKKGVQYLLPAFREIMKSNPNVNLTIAGDGPWLNRLKSITDGLKIPESKITFTGFISGNIKNKIIDKTDIFMVPSIIASDGDTEGLPVSLLEGLAAGKICIATNESGADDILKQGDNGFLVPQKNIGALVRALQQALTLNINDESRITSNAVKTAIEFSWEKTANKYYEFLLKHTLKD